ncbi:MAG: glycoside hydrolase family 6 protein [Pseudolysinimonas sp.]
MIRIHSPWERSHGTRDRRTRYLPLAAVAAVILGVLAAAPANATTGGGASGHALPPTTRFALHQPSADAVKQVASLVRQRQLHDAALIGAELATPQADWFTKGTPATVRRQVNQTVTIANALGRTPTLVIYYVPGRDCSQYSSGGAASDADYRAWIDAFVSGLGRGKAVVVVEPDGLANLPSDCASAYPGQDVDALTTSRLADIKYAADTLENRAPNASIYLDAGNSAWLNVGEITRRLLLADVNTVNGFALNVSNYQYTVNSDDYGTWVAECLAYATTVSPGGYDSCPNQYWNGGPSNNWTGVALDRYQPWSSTAVDDPTHYTGAIDERFSSMLNGVVPTAHFIVDTSRNGRGPNDMSAYAAAPYNQPASVISALQNGGWCNPPGAGLGHRPTASTGVPLVDAYLWVKNPGESDGQCNIAGGARSWDYSQYNPWNWDTAAQQQNDPLWGITDPAAGAWFPQQALQLARNAQG